MEIVRFAGILIGRAKLEALRSADAFVLPSYTEGLPNAMIEAMAAGLPVVVSAVGSVPDVVVHGVNGLLVSPRDGVSLEGAMRRILSSPELRLRLGREAHRVASERFAPESAASRLVALIEEVVQENRARRTLMA
jgi:glycosyltransferase involved in cell wall biosynthesis